MLLPPLLLPCVRAAFNTPASVVLLPQHLTRRCRPRFTSLVSDHRHIPGYWGIGLREGVNYNFTFYAKSDGMASVRGQLVDPASGKV